ncbi:MAG: hypothetical protein D6E12_02505 [Desulfovibrio sp.]|nr:MAG: hypothetical protein D6E12_02505 [Desulfovibrio sp.]
MECPKTTPLKERHTHGDFLYFKLFTAVPLFAAIMGFIHTNPWMLIPYIAWISLHMALVYRLLCTHCPHYGAYNGKTQCHFIWAVPPVYKARPHRQNLLEKIGVNLLLFVSILFPVYWLIDVWELLVFYLLGIAVLMITMMRFECTRCRHFTCAHNRAPQPDDMSDGQPDDPSEEQPEAAPAPPEPAPEPEPEPEQESAPDPKPEAPDAE